MSRAADFSDVRSYLFGVLFVMVGAALVLAGCDVFGTGEDGDEELGPVEAIDIYPDSVAIEAGEQVDFSVAALTASGDTVPDADIEIRWWSTDTTVFTVEENGLATGQGSGTAYCMVEASTPAASVRAGKTSSADTALSPNVPIGLDSAVVHLF